MRSTSARGRGFAAYLSACGGQPFIVRCAHYAREASLTTFGFVTTVPRYLLVQVIPSHSFAALTALVVRRVNSGVALFVRRINGFADRPRLACTGSPHAPRRGIGVRTRQRHLAARACCAPHKWLCRPTAALPVPAARTPPVGALACAPGSGTLPPHGQKKPQVVCEAT